jgi:hypothetical protein
MWLRASKRDFRQGTHGYSTTAFASELTRKRGGRGTGPMISTLIGRAAHADASLWLHTAVAAYSSTDIIRSENLRRMSRMSITSPRA